MSPSPSRRDAAPLAGLGAVAGFLFRAPLLGRGVLFRRDISLVWYPQVESFVRCIARGSWPLWDPYRGFGQPLLADPSSESLYPFTWLNLFLPPWVSYTVFVVAHLWLSGVGLYALARLWGASRGGAFVGAAVWMASGPFLSLASTWHHMAGAAWIPWVVLAADMALARPSLAAATAWGAALAGQILAGSADMVAMTLVGLAVLFVARGVGRSGPERVPLARCAAIAALAGAIGLGLSACQWIPTVDMALGTARLGLAASERTLWSLHPLSLLEMALPFHWNLVPLSPRAMASILDSREPWLHSIYLGGPVLGLAVAGVASRNSRRLALGAIAVGAVAVGLGRHSWAYDVVVLLVPPLRILRFPMKTMVLSAFALAILAAMGIDRANTMSSAPRSAGRLVLPAALVTLSVVATGAVAAAIWGTSWWGPWLLARGPGLPSDGELLATTTPRLWAGFAFTGLAAAVAILGAAARLPPRWAAWALGGLAVLDPVAAHRDLHPVAPKAIFTHRPEVVGAVAAGADPRVYVYDYSTRSPSQQRGGAAPSPFALASVPAGWTPLQALTLGALDYLTPPTGARWGIRGSYDLDLLGLQPRPLAELNDFLREQEGRPTHTRLLRMGSVSSLIDLAPPSRWPDLELTATLPSLFPEPIRVYGVPEPLPRTYAVGSAVVADGAEALRLIDSGGFDPETEIVLPSGPALRASGTFAGHARSVVVQPDRVVVEAQLGQPGYVVLLDAYAPGWRAAVDGHEARLLRANVAFRAVEVTPGAHEVEFLYRPPSVVGGAILSAATLLGTILWLRGRARAGRP
jgi:hypothetical protein